MKKSLSLLLIGIICLVPVIAAAQSGGTSGGGTTGTGGYSTPSSPSSPSGSSPTPSTGSPTSPSASPPAGSPNGKSLSTITNMADCEKAGGQWQAATSVCQQKK